MKKLLTIIIIVVLAWYLVKFFNNFNYEKAFTYERVLDKALDKADRK